MQVRRPRGCRGASSIGGGIGSWSIAIAQRHQHLTGAVLELPTAVELARTRVAAAELGHRITVITGDAMAGELPAGYDVVLLPTGPPSGTRSCSSVCAQGPADRLGVPLLTPMRATTHSRSDRATGRIGVAGESGCEGRSAVMGTRSPRVVAV